MLVTRSMIGAALITVVAAPASPAQMPSALDRLSPVPVVHGADGRVLPQATVAGNNPWLLAGSFSVKPLAGNGRFSDEWLLTSAKIVHTIKLTDGALGGVQLPVMANLAQVAAKLGEGSKPDSLNAALQTLVTGEEGINIGVYPYWPLGRGGGSLRPTLFTAAAAKLNSYLVDSTTKARESLLVGRFLAGVEFAVGTVAVDDKPLTLSLAAVYSSFSASSYEKIFGKRRSSLVTGELTLVLPLRAGMGMIFEGIAVQQEKPSFRLGLLMAAGKSSSSGTSENKPAAEVACSPDCELRIDVAAGVDPPIALTLEPSGLAGSSSCSAVRTGDTCLVRAPKGTSITVKVPTGFVLADGGCNGSSCTIPLAQSVKIRVTKAGPGQ